MEYARLIGELSAVFTGITVREEACALLQLVTVKGVGGRRGLIPILQLLEDIPDPELSAEEMSRWPRHVGAWWRDGWINSQGSYWTAVLACLPWIMTDVNFTYHCAPTLLCFTYSII